MRILDALVMAAEDTTTNIESEAFAVDHMYVGMIQVVWTGTTDGDVKVQVSNDPFDADSITWTDLASATLAPGGSASNGVIHLADIGYRTLRLVYTATSGSGLMTASLFAKGA